MFVIGPIDRYPELDLVEESLAKWRFKVIIPQHQTLELLSILITHSNTPDL